MGSAEISARKRLRRLYGNLYKKSWRVRTYHCIYCGDSADAIDHVPSLDSVDILGTKYFYERGISLLLVESCRECNNLLGIHDFYSVEDRRKYLKTKYLQRYAKILNSPDFSDQEIKEFGNSLKQSLINAQTSKRHLLKKLVNLDGEESEPP